MARVRVFFSGLNGSDEQEVANLIRTVRTSHNVPVMEVLQSDALANESLSMEEEEVDFSVLYEDDWDYPTGVDEYYDEGEPAFSRAGEEPYLDFI